MSPPYNDIFVQLLSEESNFGAYKLSTFDFTQYLRLDSSAVRALNLEAQPGDSNTHHLAGLLNSCSLPQGRRLLQQWLRQPLLDKNKIGEYFPKLERYRPHQRTATFVFPKLKYLQLFCRGTFRPSGDILLGSLSEVHCAR